MNLILDFFADGFRLCRGNRVLSSLRWLIYLLNGEQKYPPKVMAEVDGKSEKIFGWHTPVESCGYDKFLAEFLPELVKELKELGVFDNTIFHVSDELLFTMRIHTRKRFRW